MRISLLFFVVCSLAFCSPARAVDYSEIDRTIAKEPVYQGSPKYALVLFGKEATLHVWIVVDGQTVYIDRNADGDLTGKDERFARTEDCRNVAIDDPDGKTRYIIKYLNIYKHKDQTEEFLSVDIDIKGSPSYGQYCSVMLKRRAQEARIAHFHGPLTMGPLTVNWKVPKELTLQTGDKPTDMRGHIGTLNAEHGCWVVVRSHNGDKSAFPEEVFPVVEVEFRSKLLGGAPVKKRYVLDKFC